MRGSPVVDFPSCQRDELVIAGIPAGAVRAGLARVAELADALDLGSSVLETCGFESHQAYGITTLLSREW